jgi:hypothetical protein
MIHFEQDFVRQEVKQIEKPETLQQKFHSLRLHEFIKREAQDEDDEW